MRKSSFETGVVKYDAKQKKFNVVYAGDFHDEDTGLQAEVGLGYFLPEMPVGAVSVSRRHRDVSTFSPVGCKLDAFCDGPAVAYAVVLTCRAPPSRERWQTPPDRPLV